MTPRRLRPAFLAPALLVCSHVASAAIFVSPTGNDKSAGTRSAPLRSLQVAIERARTTRDHEVDLLSGTFRLATPFVLHVEDSGLKLIAAPGAGVVISGGVALGGWKPGMSKGLWVTKLPAGIELPRQIYVDGIRANRTRGRLPVELTMTDTGYTAADDTLAHWRHPESLEMVYTGGNAVWGEITAGLGSWTEPRCPVSSIHGTAITMAEPCWTNSTKRVMLPSGARSANLVGPASVGKQPVNIENAYELLGRPGEFYCDPETREVFYTPRRGEKMTTADVEVPVLETLVSIEGKPDAPVHDVTVQGIQFSYAAWHEPSTNEGFSEIQANYRVTGKDGATKQGLCTLVPGGKCPFAAWTQEPGNVRAMFADDVHFERDVFTHLGAAGLAIGGGAHNNIVEGCTFYDVSGNGVELAGVDEPEAADARFAIGNRIENNLFTDVGAEFRGGIPIVVGYARHTHIAHNTIHDIPYAAISIGWGGWPDKIALPGVTNRSTGNVIERNRITRLMLTLSDGGGIYTQGRTGETLADGEVVAENVVDEQVSTGHALYCDNGSAMVTTRDNVVFHTNFDNWGARHKDYYDGGKGDQNDPLTVETNWWEQGDFDTARQQVTEQGNHLISSLEESPAAIRESAGLEPKYRDLLQSRQGPHVPEAPMAVTAFIVGKTAWVNWRAPVDTGGSPVTGYLVRSSDGDEVSVTAQDYGRFYYAKLPLKSAGSMTFTVAAANAVGESAVSLPSRTIAPERSLPLPGPMQNVRVLQHGTKASIHFGMPKENGEDLVGLVVAIDDEQHKQVLNGSRIVTLEGRHVSFFTIGDLTPGKHRFGVAALNGQGQGEMVWVDPEMTAKQEKQ